MLPHLICIPKKWKNDREVSSLHSLAYYLNIHIILIEKLTDNEIVKKFSVSYGIQILLLFPTGYQMNSSNMLVEYFSTILFNNDQTPTNTSSIRSISSTCSKLCMHSFIIFSYSFSKPYPFTSNETDYPNTWLRVKILKVIDIKFLLPSSHFICLVSRYFLILSIVLSSTD
jgi:hypothetical protein